MKFLPLLPLLLWTLGFEWAVKSGKVPSYLVPAPSQVIESLTTDSAQLWEAAYQTSYASFAGFFLSLVVGVLVGVALASSKWVERTFYPYAVFFQTVPIIAIAPLLVIWFGYGAPTIIASSFIVSVFPVIASTFAGLRSTDPALLDLFQLYGAGPLDRTLKLKLPAALPGILTGAKIAGGLSVIGAIVGEFIAGGGLGGVVDEARTQQRVDRVFASVLLASALGLVVYHLVGAASRYLLKNWHASEREI